MSDFVVFFPSLSCQTEPAAFTTLDRIYHDVFHAHRVYKNVIGGGAILRAHSFDREPKLFIGDDNASWIVVKGILFDIRQRSTPIDFQELLDFFLDKRIADFNNYEGSFALAAWDAKRKQGWALNDQASSTNLYYFQHHNGCYVATNAMSLANALNLDLNAEGVQEFLFGDGLHAPHSMFLNLYRLDVGEHILCDAGKTKIRKHWHAYKSEVPYESLSEAANAVRDVIVDRFSRYCVNSEPIVCDLTGGYDSRLLASVANTLGVEMSVTVNGSPNTEDVRIARRIAEKMGWEMEYFDTDTFWQTDVTPDVRRELVYRTSGELRFNEIYHHLLSRPGLGRKYNLHVVGAGGELLRYYPWSQEFIHIGRRRTANVTRALDYRYFKGFIPYDLASQDFVPHLRARMESKLKAIFSTRPPGARNTQQLDAAYVWKKTDNPALYLSATYNWLPSVTPLLTAGVIECAISLPWRLRMTSRLQRMIIESLSPEAAEIETTYGGIASPLRISNIHHEAFQLMNRTKKLTGTVNRVLLKGKISKTGKQVRLSRNSRVPYLTEEFKAFLDPNLMKSREMYDPEGLKRLLHDNTEDWMLKSSLILRVATIEQICQELGLEPGPDYLAPQ